jgi:sugar O-acyltransferase (sialic acid O-acetyltransferase NeuD family)
MGPLVIVGAGSLAKLAHYYFCRDSRYEVVAFAVSAALRTEDSFMGLPVLTLEDLAQHYPPASCSVFVAIGYTEMNRARERVYQAMKRQGYTLASYVSSHCTYLSDTPPGDNCLIMEDNTIQPFVRIGNNVILWSGNHIGHDTIIDDHCFITSHVVVAGFTQIKPFCFVGGNAVISGGRPITLGAATLISAGCVVHRSTEPGSVYAPVRSRRLRIHSEQTNL